MRLYEFQKQVRPLLDFLNTRNLEWKIVSVQRGFHVLYVHDSIGETSYKRPFFELVDRVNLATCYSQLESSYMIF